MRDGSVGHCTTVMFMCEILNCSRSLANNELHSSSNCGVWCISLFLVDPELLNVQPCTVTRTRR